ncbi:MAG: hypothetical protein JST43_04360 [Bacteroidetes bacterium]|nr:hypothetical protein [Bacteroidota bacterium]MBS1539945.1 hypothetical protein [Bacteroidota bacterium]
MENESFFQRFKRTLKKIFIRLLLALLVVGVIYFSFTYWGVYERGVMAGKMIRLTQKGMLFKTYEGKLSLETFGALKNTSPIAETFDFSVESDQTDLIKELEQVALSGERINLKYVKRYAIFPWRGDTRYFAEGVERVK